MQVTIPDRVHPGAQPIALRRLCDNHHGGECGVFLWSDGTVAHSRIIDTTPEGATTR